MGILYREDFILIEDGQIIFSENPSECQCCGDSSVSSSEDSSSSSECERRLFVTWRLDGSIIQQSSSPDLVHTATTEQDGVSLEFTFTGRLLGLEECISNDTNDVIVVRVVSTQISNPPGIFGDSGVLGIPVESFPENDYFGEASIGLRHPDIMNGAVFSRFDVEWIYVDQ